MVYLGPDLPTPVGSGAVVVAGNDLEITKNTPNDKILNWQED